MNNKEFHYKRLIREYDIKRTSAVKEQRRRAKEVYLKVPQIEEIDKILSQSGVQLVRSMLKEPNTLSIENFRKNSEDLMFTKKMLLVEAGFPEDYLEILYECASCEDTGFIDNKPCICFRQGLINIAYEQSNLKNILQIENFNGFNLNYYSKQVDPASGRSPYTNMEKIYQICVGFIENFETKKQNLLFYGHTGLGKTFLCNCIAKELLDRNYTVLYLTSPQLFKLFEESRFHREDMMDEAKAMLSTLFTVDLLIIDDLGTESSSTFTGSDLFDVLNTRYLHQNATIISTNVAPNDWNKYYSERIVSRVFGNYTNLKFIGSDIRLLKKYTSNNL
ncbi:ATP-binding protein [Cellulosilyticum sp. I15G10I2]|uniref:ATP-binding protein n=1 Tax=Cellulosilyticum sp. I15G10I2 TaxID=1892843 RepID=UPI000A97561D|nr:ATP-binding protein [Cellulosilyticum sp. I15G10I2]